MRRQRARSSGEVYFDLMMAAVYIGMGLGVLVRYAANHYEQVLVTERIAGVLSSAGFSAEVAATGSPHVHLHIDPSEQQL